MYESETGPELKQLPLDTVQAATFNPQAWHGREHGAVEAGTMTVTAFIEAATKQQETLAEEWRKQQPGQTALECALVMHQQSAVSYGTPDTAQLGHTAQVCALVMHEQSAVSPIAPDPASLNPEVTCSGVVRAEALEQGTDSREEHPQ